MPDPVSARTLPACKETASARLAVFLIRVF